LVGVAVKVTDVPAQMLLSASEDEMVTDAGAFGITVVVILFDVTVGLAVHETFDVNTTETTSPLAKAVVVYVALLVPTLLPFNSHW
jgi:hypothetical protein